MEEKFIGKNLSNITSSLPTEHLSQSFFVDLLLFLTLIKPTVRSKFTNHSHNQKLEEWCTKLSIYYLYDSEGYFFLSREEHLLERLKTIDKSSEPHEYEFGLILGYPECCATKISEVGESNIDDYFKFALSWDYLGDYRYINPKNYLYGKSLVSHIPCCSSCNLSLGIALSAMKFIKSNLEVEFFTRWKEWI